MKSALAPVVGKSPLLSFYNHEEYLSCSFSVPVVKKALGCSQPRVLRSD
jgi:hypothetical protein